MPTAEHRLVIAGTGTEIGKTHAAVALVSAFARRGLVAVGLKPIESGIQISLPDSARLALVSSRPTSPPPYAFVDALSPHLAARRAGITIQLDVVSSWVAAHPAEVLVIETAGGVFSPLSDVLINLDLIRHLAPHSILLVAPDRLGVLHDLRACLTAMRFLAPELPTPSVLLQPPLTPDSSTGTNAPEIERLGIARVLAVFPRAEVDSPPYEAAALHLSKTLLPDLAKA
jgi:dethiobiotin synthetase